MHTQQDLFAAIQAGEASQTQALLAGGVSPDGFDDAGRTPLVLSIQRWAQGPGCQDVVRMLLAAGASPNVKGFDDWTPLMHAASQGYAPACTMLLDAGANPDRANLKGCTALMIAANTLQEAVIAVLLARGASAQLVDVNGRGALDRVGLRTKDGKKIKRCRQLLADAGAVTGAGHNSQARRARMVPRWWKHFSADELTQTRHPRIGGKTFPVLEILFSVLAVWLVREGNLAVVLLGWAALALVVFPSIVQLPWLLLARPDGPAPEAPDPPEPNANANAEAADGTGQLDAVSNFMRLGWGAQVRFALSRRVRLTHTRSHLASIGLALAILLTILAMSMPDFDNWVVTTTVPTAVTLIALALEDRLRKQRLKAFQASRDHLATEINAKLAEATRRAPQRDAAFVLYLRTFGVTGLLNIGGLDFETSMAYNLTPMMPMIALGHPGEAIGAGRILTTDEHWQEEILRLVDSADRIMLIPSHREGTKWEIARLKEGRHFGKTIFAMPPQMDFAGGLYSDEWNRAAAALAPLGVSLPPHYWAGLLFTLGPDGAIQDHAPLQGRQFIIDWVRILSTSNWHPPDSGIDSGAGADAADDGGDGWDSVDAADGGSEGGAGGSADGSGLWGGSDAGAGAGAGDRSGAGS